MLESVNTIWEVKDLSTVRLLQVRWQRRSIIYIVLNTEIHKPQIYQHFMQTGVFFLKAGINFN